MPDELEKTRKIEAEAAAPELSPAGVSTLVEVDLAASTDRGKVRDNNEDHYIVARFDRAMRTLADESAEGRRARVDMRKPCMAFSWPTASAASGRRSREPNCDPRDRRSRASTRRTGSCVWTSPSREEVLDRMERRFQKVREVLVERAKADPKLRGMATTLTVACSLGPVLLTAHVGDTARVSFPRRQADAPDARPDDGAIARRRRARSGRMRSRSHPMRHVLTSALGARAAPSSRSRSDGGVSKTATGCSSAPTA